MEAPDADRGRGCGDPSSAPARNEHPWNSQVDRGYRAMWCGGICHLATQRAWTMRFISAAALVLIDWASDALIGRRWKARS